MTDLADFAAQVRPLARVIAPCGQFPLDAGYTFFRRRADQSISATEVLALARNWLATVTEVTAAAPAIALGYSSGAIFAEALLTVRTDIFRAAVLMRPEPLSETFRFPPLDGLPVLVLAGRFDDHRRPEDAPRLVRQLENAGAKVALLMLEAGHGWAKDHQDIRCTRSWLHEEGLDSSP